MKNLYTFIKVFYGLPLETVYKSLKLLEKETSQVQV